MKRRLELLIAGLIFLLLLLFGATAIFTAQVQKRITVGTASMGLTYQLRELNEKWPVNLTPDTVIYREFDITNIGSVPVYLLEEPYLLAQDESLNRATSIKILEVREEGAVLDENLRKNALKPEGTRTYRCELCFPGLGEIEEGSITLNGGIRVKAFTNADCQSGFQHGPLDIPVYDFQNGELQKKAKSTRVHFEERIIDYGNVEIKKVNWYRAEQSFYPSTEFDSKDWIEFDASEDIELCEQPVYVRYEVATAAGVIRSNIYAVSVRNGHTEKYEYDLFTGERREMPDEI
jgi:hypothetical protein